MKVAYFYQMDAADVAVQSGRPASIFRHLADAGTELLPVFPLRTRVSRASALKKALYRLSGRSYRGDREPRYLSAIASEFHRKTRGMEYDMVFCPGSVAVSHLDIVKPIAFCADATFASMVDYYWDFSSLAPEYVLKGHLQEEAALRRAAIAVYPSEWAARSAIEVYDANPANVFVIPFGANLGAHNGRAQVHQWIARRGFDVLRLLFVGRSWQRKGGDLVLETARRLIAKGFQVKLDIVGCEVPRAFRHLPWITDHGPVDLHKPEREGVLAELFKAAHFVFIPSRAEAYGMAFAEASAFGVPAIATATGGITSAIHDGVNGFTLPLSAGPADYAERIAASVSQRERYDHLCRSSFDEFERRLNWRVFCARFLEIAHQHSESVAIRAEGAA
jgi:glycosyltransferase involved in cell wall biosynthesis